MTRRTVLSGVAAVGAAVILSAAAFGGIASAHHSNKMEKDTIVVKITTTGGTTWGKVTADWMAHGKMKMGMACEHHKCVYHVPHMTKITLTETPTSPSTWPFKHWLVKGSSMGHPTMSSKNSVTFEAMGMKATAKAVYKAM